MGILTSPKEARSFYHAALEQCLPVLNARLLKSAFKDLPPNFFWRKVLAQAGVVGIQLIPLASLFDRVSQTKHLKLRHPPNLRKSSLWISTLFIASIEIARWSSNGCL
jgi:hypothetical protein